MIGMPNGVLLKRPVDLGSVKWISQESSSYTGYNGVSHRIPGKTGFRAQLFVPAHAWWMGWKKSTLFRNL